MIRDYETPGASNRPYSVTDSVVLILTHPADLHAAAVQVHLDAAGVEVHCLDTAALGTTIQVSAHVDGGVLTGMFGQCDLARVAGVWHRRPSRFSTGNPEDAAELRAGVGGILAALPHLNHPADMAAASFKPYQLALAGRCGLSVPETVVTTEVPSATALADRLGNAVVVKPMSKETPAFVTEGDRSGWERAMHLTQARVTTTRHIRLTVVDGVMLAARIESAYLDWRRDIAQCSYHRVETPDEVANAVRALLARLRLRFAAIDFAVDDDDRWWFLEVNPNGQWLWIEEATGLPISANIARALSGEAIDDT